MIEHKTLYQREREQRARAGNAARPGQRAKLLGRAQTKLLAGLLILAIMILAGCGTTGGTQTGTGSQSATSTSGNTNTPTPASQLCTMSGFTSYTSPDHTFCFAYPSGWMTSADPNGSNGIQLEGPGQQFFTVTNLGANYPYTPQASDDRYCMGLAGSTSPTTSVTIGGQAWTQEQCTIGGGQAIGVIEGIIYKGDFFGIVYASPPASFGSDKSQFFAPMEQSFKFLS